MATLLFGDSLADDLPLPESVVVAAHPRATTEQLLYGFPSLEYYLEQDEHTTVILLAGTNDLSCTASPNHTVENLLILGAQARTHGARVIVCTLLHDEFNALHRSRAPVSTQWCTFINEDMDTTFLADDAVHLSDDGKVQFTKALLNLV